MEDAGEEKHAAAVAAALEGPVTSMITVSALQLHRDTVCFVDEEAAGELRAAGRGGSGRVGADGGVYNPRRRHVAKDRATR